MQSRYALNKYDYTMSRVLEEAKVGNFSLEKTIIQKGTILRLYNRRGGRIIMGKYVFDYPLVVLKEGSGIWMSDAQLEVESAMGAAEAAKGQVLIGGLGIGLLPTLIKDKVTHITIIEKYKEVIDLVFHQLDTRRMSIIQGDIFEYLDQTEKKYDLIHIDVWPDLYAPFTEIEKAREKANRRLNPGGVVWCWLQELYDNVKERLPIGPLGFSDVGPPAIYEPCLVCGKTIRNDYAGLCMDCADSLEVSELFVGRKQ